MEIFNKIILGTVQFGLPYGINNQIGKPVGIDDVKLLLQLANQHGIHLLDTSPAYGNSEDVLGKCHLDEQNFQVISKFPQGTIKVKDIFEQSLRYLNINSLYGYLIHHFSFYKEHPMIWNDFLRLRESGRVQKIGFSLYSPAELEFVLDKDLSFDLVQIPYNILDRSFEPYFDELKKRKIEIHTRSVFLQGLFFKPVDNLPNILKPLQPYLSAIHTFCLEERITIEELALSFCLYNLTVDGVLIGVDNLKQLQDNLKSIRNQNNTKILDFVSTLNVAEKQLLNPVNWK